MKGAFLANSYRIARMRSGATVRAATGDVPHGVRGRGARAFAESVTLTPLSGIFYKCKKMGVYCDLCLFRPCAAGRFRQKCGLSFVFLVDAHRLLFWCAPFLALVRTIFYGCAHLGFKHYAAGVTRFGHGARQYAQIPQKHLCFSRLTETALLP